ncbi:MAG: hypothetical protein AAFP76_10670 [Bacteroidota bacterium]
MRTTSFLLALLLLIACSDDDNTNETNNANPELSALQMQGSWIVSYFWDQSVQTSEYNDFLFVFDANSSIEVQIEDISVGGSYDRYQANIEGVQSTVLDFFFQESDERDINDKLRELTEEWIVTAISEDGNTVEFLERVSNNPPEILHLTRE